MKIYVSGPAVNNLSEDTLPCSVYNIIKEKLGDKYQVELPIRTPDLSTLSPTDFYKEISKKIASADGVITLLVPDDQSTPVEAAAAALAHKPQVILHTFDPPRLLLGLPTIGGHEKIDPAKVQESIGKAISILLDSLEGPKK